jgi:hypothetical protein
MIVLEFFIGYIIVGAFFSLPFLIKWLPSMDEAAHDAHWSFKIVLLPGTIVLWPLLLAKFIHFRKSKF